MKTKKVLAFLTCLSLGALFAAPYAGSGAVLKDGLRNIGNFNDDNVVNVLDLNEMCKAYEATQVDGVSYELKYDLNHSGTFTKTDIMFLGKSLCGKFSFYDNEKLLINEVCASNLTLKKDGNGKYSDYIELYNGTKNAIDLTGYGLSDGKKTPFKWIFPEGTTIKAGSYLTVWASGDEPPLDAYGNPAEFHASFSISKSGETILLTAPDEVTADLIKIPALDDDIAYGRYKNGSDIWKALSPSFGASNDDAHVVNNASAVMPLEFSRESGFYQESFDLSVISEENAQIFYTADGTAPTKDSNKLGDFMNVYNRSTAENVYSAINNMSNNDFKPFVKVDKATVVRAMGFEPNDGNYGNPETKSYFVGLDKDVKYPGTAVISITTDPENLFDYEKGIFVKGKRYDDWIKENPRNQYAQDWEIQGNFTQRGRDWERKVQVDFFEGDGSLGFSEALGMRVTGNASRTAGQKSLKFYARSEYGVKNIKYDLLPGLVKKSDGETPVTKFDTFILRTGANDAEYAKIRDAYIQESVKDLSFDTQDSRPCVVYIDGEYWGAYMIMQDYSDKFVETHYGVPAEEAVIIKNGSEVDEGTSADLKLWGNVINYAYKDLTNETNYKELIQLLDVDQYAEYCAVETYVANWDWPNNNYRVWRSRATDDANPYMDGRFRFMMYDTEYSLNLYVWEEEKSPGTEITADSINKVKRDYPLFNALMKNADFSAKFYAAFEKMREDVFKPANANKRLDEMAKLYEPLMADNINRNGPSWVVNPTNGWKQWGWKSPAVNFTNEITKIKEFLSGRYDYYPQLIK